MLFSLGDDAGGGGEDAHAEAGALQVMAHQLGDVPVVLDHEDGLLHGEIGRASCRERV